MYISQESLLDMLLFCPHKSKTKFGKNVYRSQMKRSSHLDHTKLKQTLYCSGFRIS